MFKTYTPVCNNNCACADSECMFRHYLRYKDRKVVVKICRENPSVISSNKKESNIEIRKSNCTYGYLCTNDSCNYRHFLNPAGRRIISNLYNKQLDASSDASVTSVPSVSSVSSVSSQISSISSASTVVYKNKKENKNVYSTLEQLENKIEDEKIPSIVVTQIKKFEKSYSDIVKKSPDDYAQEKFDLMMASESKDSWGDY